MYEVVVMRYYRDTIIIASWRIVRWKYTIQSIILHDMVVADIEDEIRLSMVWYTFARVFGILFVLPGK